MKLQSVIALSLILSTPLAFGGGDHASPAGKKEPSEHAESGHDHGEEEESPGNVGPDKGITESSEKNGFKLSAEALKNFSLQFVPLSGDGPWTISREAVVHSGEEINVFRRRAGFFKRVDFQSIRKTDKDVTIDSDDLREGDEVVVAGLGFLRIAELAASGGVAHGHSH